MSDPTDLSQRVARQLRADDLWQIREDRLWLLCHACDEVDVLAVGQRLGAEVVAAHVATGAHLLGDLVPAARRGGSPGGAERRPA